MAKNILTGFIPSMNITINSFRPTNNVVFHTKPQIKPDRKQSGNFACHNNALAQQNKALISFQGYYGDQQPVKKLYWHLTGQNRTYFDEWTQNRLWRCGSKAWVNAYPDELLKRSAGETINSILTITGQSEIPTNVQPPNIRGDSWGRYANYIEINPRVIAKYDKGCVSDGLLQTMKIMTAIPPSSNNVPNCLILSQLYPSFYGDGTNHDESLYCANLHAGISKNLTARGLDHKMGDDEQVKAFNELAHLMGFRTGIRMPISSGQLRVQNRDFSWQRDEKAFIDACAWAVELGFDAIYFDSAKHVIDMDGYCGVGDVPNKEQMAYMLNKIREQTGRFDLAFIGEKCNPNPEYQQMGFTAGTHWSDPENMDSVLWESKQQEHSYNYACGPEVSNDNDYGELSFETRLKRLNSCLYGYEREKLPAFMQLNDIFPLSPYINTHQVMMHSIQLGTEQGYTDCEKHWNVVLRTDEDARVYTQRVYDKFHHAMYR